MNDMIRARRMFRQAVRDRCWAEASFWVILAMPRWVVVGLGAIVGAAIGSAGLLLLHPIM